MIPEPGPPPRRRSPMIPEPTTPILVLIRPTVRDLRTPSRLEPRRAMGVPALGWVLALIDRLAPRAADVESAGFSWLTWSIPADCGTSVIHVQPPTWSIRLHVDLRWLLGGGSRDMGKSR